MPEAVPQDVLSGAPPPPGTGPARQTCVCEVRLAAPAAGICGPSKPECQRRLPQVPAAVTASAPIALCAFMALTG